MKLESSFNTEGSFRQCWSGAHFKTLRIFPFFSGKRSMASKEVTYLYEHSIFLNHSAEVAKYKRHVLLVLILKQNSILSKDLIWLPMDKSRGIILLALHCFYLRNQKFHQNLLKVLFLSSLNQNVEMIMTQSSKN